MVKTRGVIFLLVLLFSSNTVLGFQSIFNDYIYTLDTFELEGNIFYAGLANGENVMVLHKNEFDTYYIHKGDCEDTAYYRYCFSDTKLDYEDYGRQIPNSYEWEPALHLQILSKAPAISFERTLEETKINRDDKLIVTIDITNDGELEITNVEFNEIIPPTAIIDNVGEGFIRVGDTLKATRTTLYPDQTMSLVYSIKPTSYDSIVFNNGTISYEYEDLDFEETFATDTLNINYPLSVTSSLSNINPGVQEEFTYTLTVKNNDWDDDINFDFTLDIPERINVVSVSTGLDSSNYITHSLVVNEGDEDTFTVTMKSPFEDYYRISQSWGATIRDEEYLNETTLNVNVTLPKLNVDLILSKSELFEGNPFTITVNVENPSEVDYYDLFGTIYSPLFKSKPFNRSYLRAGQSYTVFEEQITGLSVITEKTFNITMNGNYRSSNNQLFSFYNAANVKVKPVTVGFEITKTVDKTEIYAGQELIVKVKVKNLGQKVCVVDLKENMDDAFELVTGIIEKSITLSIGDEEEFYIYKVRVPPTTPAGTYSLSTFLDYAGVLNQTKNTSIIVKVNETVVDTPNKTSNLNPDFTPQSREKKSFFKAVLDFFIGIFK